MARLIDVLRDLLQPRGMPSVFFEKGVVTQVWEDGKLSVTASSGTVPARPTTDEVFRVGDVVWISQAGSEFIVHGGAR